MAQRCVSRERDRVGKSDVDGHRNVSIGKSLLALLDRAKLLRLDVRDNYWPQTGIGVLGEKILLHREWDFFWGTKYFWVNEGLKYPLYV